MKMVEAHRRVQPRDVVVMDIVMARKIGMKLRYTSFKKLDINSELTFLFDPAAYWTYLYTSCLSSVVT